MTKTRRDREGLNANAGAAAAAVAAVAIGVSTPRVFRRVSRVTRRRGEEAGSHGSDGQGLSGWVAVEGG